MSTTKPGRRHGHQHAYTRVSGASARCGRQLADRQEAAAMSLFPFKRLRRITRELPGKGDQIRAWRCSHCWVRTTRCMTVARVRAWPCWCRHSRSTATLPRKHKCESAVPGASLLRVSVRRFTLTRAGAKRQPKINDACSPCVWYREIIASTPCRRVHMLALPDTPCADLVLPLPCDASPT